MLLGSMPLASLTCAVRGDRTPVFASELGISGAVRSGDKAGNEHCGDLTSVSSGELGYDPESDSLKEAAVIQTDRQGEDAYYQPYGARTELRHNLAYSADLEYYEKCEHGKTCCPVGKSGRDEKYQHQTEYTEILPCGAGHGFCFCGDKSNNEHYCDRQQNKEQFLSYILRHKRSSFFLICDRFLNYLCG